MRLRVNALVSLADQAIISCSNFAMGLLVARLLGLEQFGVYSVMMVFYFLCQSLQRAMITTPLISMRNTVDARETDIFNSVFSSVQIVFICCSLAVSVLAYVLFLLAGGKIDFASFFLFMCFLLVSLNHDYIRGFLYSIGRYPSVLFVDAIKYGLTFVFFTLAIVDFEEYMQLNMIFFVVSIATLISLTPFLRFLPTRYERKFWRARHFAAYFDKGWRLSASAVAQWVMGSLPLTFAGLLFGASAAGTIKSVQNLLSIANIFFQSAENFLIPRLSLLWKNGEYRAFGRIWQVSMMSSVAFMCAIVLLLMPYHRNLFNFLFSSVPENVLIVLALYSAAYIANSLLIVNRCILISKNLEGAVLKIYSVGAVVTLMSSIVLGQWLGLTGLMMSIAFAYTICAVLSCVYARTPRVGR